MNDTGTAAARRFSERLDELMAEFKREISDWPCESEALKFAVAAGLKPQMSYTVSDTAKYTGLNYQQLLREGKAGRLAIITPDGQTRSGRIKVTEVDRWMRENS